MYAYSPFAAICVLVGAVVFLRVFFTLWGPFDRKLNPQPPDPNIEAVLPELQGIPLNVRFTSGVVLENVVLTGQRSQDAEAMEFHELSQMLLLSQILVLRGPGGTEYFARAAQIEYFEPVAAIPPPESPPQAPNSDAPEDWR